MCMPRTVGKVSKMVQVRAHQPINTDGSLNLEAWLDHAVSVDAALDALIRRDSSPTRVMICGSLYLAGAVLARNG